MNRQPGDSGPPPFRRTWLRSGCGAVLIHVPLFAVLLWIAGNGAENAINEPLFGRPPGLYLSDFIEAVVYSVTLASPFAFIHALLIELQFRAYYEGYKEPVPIASPIFLGALLGLANVPGYWLCGLLLPPDRTRILAIPFLVAYAGALSAAWVAWHTGRVLYPKDKPLQFGYSSLLAFTVISSLLLFLLLCKA